MNVSCTSCNFFINCHIGSVIHTKITFKAANYRQLVNSGHLTIFRDSVVMKVCLVSGVTKERVSQAFVRAGSIVTGFALMPGEKVSDGKWTSEYLVFEKVWWQSLLCLCITPLEFGMSSLPTSRLLIVCKTSRHSWKHCYFKRSLFDCMDHKHVHWLFLVKHF